MFSCLLAFTVVVIASFTYYRNSAHTLTLSDQLMTQSSDMITQKTLHYLEPASSFTKMGATLVAEGQLAANSPTEWTRYAASVLTQYPQLSRVYVGLESGTFTMTKRSVNAEGNEILTTHITKKVGKERRETFYRVLPDHRLTVLGRRSSDFDVTSRPWYQGAVSGGDRIFWTDVYRFFSDGKPGITASFPILQQGRVVGVVGMDIELASLSHFLKEQQLSPRSVPMILTVDGVVIAGANGVDNADFSGEKKVDELGDPILSEALSLYRSQRVPRFSFTYFNVAYMAFISSLPAELSVPWKVFLLTPVDDFVGDLKRTNFLILVISGGILLVSIFLTMMVSQRVSRPIVALTEETKKIKAFNFSDRPKIYSYIWEVQSMVEAVAAMRSGLQSFNKYVPSALVRQLIKSGKGAELGGEKKEITVLFSDIAGFTTVSEHLAPEALMIQLSDYLDQLTVSIKRHDGMIDKYIGDAIMALWGTPVSTDDHAKQACKAALACRACLEKMNPEWEAEGKPAFPTRFGINTGECVVGNVGSSERMNYTALGDNVNVASRLEGLNKYYRTTILLSEATYHRVHDEFLCRLVDRVAVKGRYEGFDIYELICARDRLKKEDVRDSFCRRFAEGIALYRGQEWEKALAIFSALRDEGHEDRVTALYVGRCTEYVKTPPENWTGVTPFFNK